MVAAAYDTIADAVDLMVVVVGHNRDDVVAALAPRQFTAVDSDSDAEMFASICAGLRGCPDGASVLLQPGDHPAVHPGTLELLFAAARPDRVIIPTSNGKGGHPALIGSELWPCILAAEAPEGLAGWFRDHSDSVIRLPVDDTSVIVDIDRPSDL